MACLVLAQPLPDGETRLEWLQRRVLEQAKGFFPPDHDIDSMEDLFIILDEGQLTYGDFDFWEMLKDEKSKGTHYLILCAWGSPTKHPNNTAVYSAPLTLPPDQRIGFCHDRKSISMFFTQEEHRAAIQLWTSDSFMNPRSYLLHPSILEYLYFLTNGHPAPDLERYLPHWCIAIRA